MSEPEREEALLALKYNRPAYEPPPQYRHQHTARSNHRTTTRSLECTLFPNRRGFGDE